MSSVLRLSKLKFHAGSQAGKPRLEIDLGTVLILVGPNNSGKSLGLRELEDWCFGRDVARKVIDSIEVEWPEDPVVVESLLRRLECPPPQGQFPIVGQFWIEHNTFRQDQATILHQLRVDQVKSSVLQKNLSLLRTWLSACYTIRLDGRTRFLLTDPKATGDLQLNPKNHLWALFADDDARARVRKLTEDAFGLYFVIDPTAMQIFRIRMSKRAPLTKVEEQSLDENAREFHAKAELIRELGDGVQAFVGLVSAVLSRQFRIILVDEPEAFLHPPLARRLGSNLAQISRERSATLVAATHSPEFLIGCLETVGDTIVVRLTYENEVASARVLKAAELAELTRDPLLRSTGVLDALFHKVAVVTESDSDRAFYDEMNRRLLNENRGIKDCLFRNAQNRQTVLRLVGPLRRIGIPAAAIVDLDLLEETGSNWMALLEACQVDSILRSELEPRRTHLSDVFSGLKAPPGEKPLIKSRGINALGANDRKEAETLLKQLSSYGLFLVPRGELESWLSHLNVKEHGSDWVVSVFSQIGQSDTDTNYLKPGTDDVWKFLDEIAEWVSNPKQGLGSE
jgi:hypothetical protein